MGLLSGITGVVTKPIEGARAEGGGFSFGGLMKGMATGIVGVVAQPVKGVADMISDVGKGIDSSTARLQSLSRLAAFVAGCAVFSITLTRNYGKTEFRENLNRHIQYSASYHHSLPSVRQVDSSALRARADALGGLQQEGGKLLVVNRHSTLLCCGAE